MQNWNQSSYNIVNTIGNTYEIPNDPSIQFVFSEMKDDSAQILTVFQNGNKTTCKRKDKIAPDDLNLEEYTGDFYSGELDATYFIFIEDGNLKMKVANYDDEVLNLYDIDVFASDMGLIRFTRSNGNIMGFKLDAGRVTNLKFEKK